MSETKKDLIDLVREGKQIEIYEANQELKEGDEIRGWRDSTRNVGSEERHVVGSLEYDDEILWFRFNPIECPYCGTQMRAKIAEYRKARKGRDGLTYYREWEEKLGKVCPLCLFEQLWGSTNY